MYLNIMKIMTYVLINNKDSYIIIIYDDKKIESINILNIIVNITLFRTTVIRLRRKGRMSYGRDQGTGRGDRSTEENILVQGQGE